MTHTEIGRKTNDKLYSRSCSGIHFRCSSTWLMSAKYPWVPEDAKVQYPWAKPHGKHLYKSRTIEENMIFEIESLVAMTNRLDSVPHRSTMRSALAKMEIMLDLYEHREGLMKTTTPELTNANGEGPWVPNFKLEEK